MSNIFIPELAEQSADRITDPQMLDMYYEELEVLMHNPAQVDLNKLSICFCGSIASNICEKCYADLCDRCAVDTECSNILSKISAMEAEL